MGHLEKEVSSCAAMTGCLGREDVEVTILSKQYTESTMFRWTADDRVQVIESPFRKVNAQIYLFILCRGLSAKS